MVEEGLFCRACIGLVPEVLGLAGIGLDRLFDLRRGDADDERHDDDRGQSHGKGIAVPAGREAGGGHCRPGPTTSSILARGGNVRGRKKRSS